MASGRRLAVRPSLRLGSYPLISARRIGGIDAGSVALGCAGMSVANPPDEQQCIQTILAALDAGIALIDTAHCYVPAPDEQGHNERLIAKALASWGGGGVLVATKGGVKRTGGTREHTDLQKHFVTSGHPDFIRENCETSLTALGVETIDLYQLHAVPTDVPLTETMGVFRRLRDEGKIRFAGLSNVSLDQITEARTVIDVVAVQNRFSPSARDSLDVLRYCEREGIAFLAYSPLGGLGGRARELGAANPAFAEVSAERGVSPQQVALAWELALSDIMLPIVGARRPETIRDSAAAAWLDLTPEELARLTGEA